MVCLKQHTYSRYFDAVNRTNKFNMNWLWEELHRTGSEIGVVLNNHQATYFWKLIKQLKSPKSAERIMWDSKSSSYIKRRTEWGVLVHFWKQTDHFVVSFVKCKKKKCWDWSWVKVHIPFTAFPIFFVVKPLEGAGKWS